MKQTKKYIAIFLIALFPFTFGSCNTETSGKFVLTTPGNGIVILNTESGNVYSISGDSIYYLDVKLGTLKSQKLQRVNANW